MDIVAEGRRVFDVEINALVQTKNSLDDSFAAIVDLITNCAGRVVVTGIGKSGHIAGKWAATLSSLGTPSIYLHPAEALHGDLGKIAPDDVVIAISYSGESEEIIKMLPAIRMLAAALVGITGNPNSTLAHASDYVQVLPHFQEACYLGLAPTSSTTAALCYGDALAVVASGIYGFKDVDFGKFHPGGSLGKGLLLRVDDLMVPADRYSAVYNGAALKEAIVALCKGCGIVSVIEDDGTLAGVITDGDIRRQLEKGIDVYGLHVQEVMKKEPVTIQSGKMAVEGLRIMQKTKVIHMPVLKNGRVIGIIRLQDIINAGIIDRNPFWQ